jgi:NADPH-dependent F420 reductase
VPCSNHEATIKAIKDVVQGKIVVDSTVPFVPPKISTIELPAEGSAAQIAQRLFGDGMKVVSAFHNVGAAQRHSGERADCDVLVFGNDGESREVVIALAGDVATRSVDCGVLANSAAAEAMTC